MWAYAAIVDFLLCWQRYSQMLVAALLRMGEHNCVCVCVCVCCRSAPFRSVPRYTDIQICTLLSVTPSHYLQSVSTLTSCVFIVPLMVMAEFSSTLRLLQLPYSSKSLLILF